VKDVDTAREIVEKTAGDIGLEKDTFEQTKRLLDEYDRERENLFRQMTELLGKSDVSDLLSEWKDLCDKGKDQLRKLNDISPGNGIGVVMVGLSKFQSGEFKIWGKNAEAELARAAVDIKLIYLANLKVAQVCDEELKQFLNQKKDLLDLAEGRFGASKDVLGKMASLLKAYIDAKNYKALPSTPVQDFGKVLVANFGAVKEAAAKKKVLVDVLVARIAMIRDAQSKLDIPAIDDAYRVGESVANSLQGVGRDSPYEAEDWNDFAKECIEKLNDSKEQAEDQSREVFETLVERLKEETAKSIEALTDNPAQQEEWNDALAESFDTIQEAIDNEQKYLDDVVEGAMRQAISADWNLVKVATKLYFDEWKATGKAVLDTLKKT
jgi:hypothetical protein